MAAKKRQKGAKKGKFGPQFDIEIMYPYWEAAGGNISRAMALAAEAGEARVPQKHQTWSDYANKFQFDERLRDTEKKRWEAYHAEREKKQQQVLDKVAHTFELVFDTFAANVMADIAVMQSDDPGAAFMAGRRLKNIFGSVEAVDRFYRMYLRARGEPEKIHKYEGTITQPATYGDLEGKPKAKSPEEARRLAELVAAKQEFNDNRPLDSDIDARGGVDAS